MTGWETFGDFTNTNNTQVVIDLFPNAQIVAVEWIDLEFTTQNGSFQSEFVLSVNDSANLGTVNTFGTLHLPLVSTIPVPIPALVNSTM